VTCGLGKINLIASYQFGRFHKELLISCYPTTSKSQTLSLLTGHKSSSFFYLFKAFLVKPRHWISDLRYICRRHNAFNQQTPPLGL